MSHRLTSEEINRYCETYSSPEPSLLHTLNRQTHLRTELPQMLSGHLQGRVLSMLSAMLKPRRILEIGTFTGYSALCLAEGLAADGELITLEADPENAEMARHYFSQSEFANRIQLIEGPAADIIPGLTPFFDLVFIDADKINYALYADLVFHLLATGAYLIADNVLYQGDVLHPETAGKNARAMHAYNEKIRQDNRLESVLLPLRDGLMISRKIHS
jgi:caffeoyl-CoA O-methyltransferase